jgi:hypothetical protein
MKRTVRRAAVAAVLAASALLGMTACQSEREECLAIKADLRDIRADMIEYSTAQGEGRPTVGTFADLTARLSEAWRKGAHCGTDGVDRWDPSEPA